MRLRIASRKSDLARWQAHLVADAIRQATSQEIEFEFLFKASMGDQDLDTPLSKMGAKGVFTEDFIADLKDGRCDMVVHSWKDLPVEERAETEIVTTLPRADVRDLLLIPEKVWARALSEGRLHVLSSSPRRAYNLGRALSSLLPGSPTIEFHNVRGNVPTRLKKMHAEAKALVLAKAGLDRLLAAEAAGFAVEESLRALIADCRFQVLPISVNPPAAAQGALAIEIRRDRTDLRALLAGINDQATFASAAEERRVLKSYGGGCHQKIGIVRIERPFGVITSLKGLTDGGTVLSEWRIEDDVQWPHAANGESVFPREAEENRWFDRTYDKVDVSGEEAVFIARADAWPRGVRATPGQLLWTAGVKSWQKLAQAGLFINGCQDGLGESEPFLIEQLAGRDVAWTKLTHDRSAAVGPVSRILTTYGLKPVAQPPNLQGKTHFFWMSGTAFDQAYRLFPHELENGYNACGPGHTLEHLRSVKTLKNPVKVFAGLSQFLTESLR
jgi:hydroxymethylbilane synthase